MPRLQKTKEFEQDLIEIWHYTAGKWGAAQAEKYLRKIEESLKELIREKLP